MFRTMLALALATAACSREQPPPPNPGVASAPASTSASASTAPAFVQLRPRDFALGDPANVTARATFDLAVGAVGTLRIELVDRVEPGSEMMFEPRDPRCMFIADVAIKPPRAALEVKFERPQGVLTFVATVEAGGSRAENSAPIPAARRPSPSAQLRSKSLVEPALLSPTSYVPVVGFAWGAPIENPLLGHEGGAEPHWIVRVKFRPTL
jgi:hypothetical protein